MQEWRIAMKNRSRDGEMRPAPFSFLDSPYPPLPFSNPYALSSIISLSISSHPASQPVLDKLMPDVFPRAAKVSFGEFR
jgi:hypothetical protein